LCEANDGVVDIEIPHEFLITEFNDPLQAIVDSTYPELIENYNNENCLKSRAILANRIETVDEINEYILSLIPCKCFLIYLPTLYVLIHSTKKITNTNIVL